VSDVLAPLELREWDEKIVEGYGQPSGADLKLARSLGERGGARLDVEWLHGDRLRVHTRSWVGVVRLTRIEIRIRPKHAGSDVGLLRMLDYTSGLEALRRVVGTRDLSTGQRNLVDLICLLLVEEAEGVIRRGVLSDYVVREETVNALRGRLLLERQMAKHYGQVTELECRYDEWETDIVENRLIAAGLRTAHRFCSDPGVRSRIARTAAAFSEVCSPPEPGLVAEGQSLVYHRRNSHYRAAHQWALLLMANQAVSDLYAPARAECFAFLLDMNLVFERFVAKLLIDACVGTDVRVQRQASTRSIVVDAGTLRSYASVRPDILTEDRGVSPHRVRALDTKYKLYDDKRLDVSDLYQGFLYAYAFHNRDTSEERVATLVFPSRSSRESHRLLVQSRDGVQGAIVRAVGVDLVDAVDRIGKREPPDPALIGALLGRTTA
jgi:5-methylcytosine-specific restriction enzyme subunit McrC